MTFMYEKSSNENKDNHVDLLSYIIILSELVRNQSVVISSV